LCTVSSFSRLDPKAPATVTRELAIQARVR
jgi:hypothetical protein